MADNVNIPATGTGDTTPIIAADDIGGVKHQRVKVEWGVDGSAVDASASNPLPVTAVVTSSTLPTGASSETTNLASATALGTPTDAAATTTGSVIAQLRRIANTLAGSIGVTGTFWQATQPVSAASLPLPSGASTETTLGTASTTLTAQSTLYGGVTETAPASDTASSGLNGRLQRIAQRLTTIIGVLPAALGANGGLKIEGVASGTSVPVSGTFTANPAADLTASGSLSSAGSVSITTLNGNGTATIAASGSVSGLAAVIEATIDGTNWFSISYANAATPSAVSLTSVTTPGNYLAQVSGFSGVRFRVGTVTGTLTVAIRSGVGNVTVQNVSLAQGTSSIGTVALGAGSAKVGLVALDHTTPGSTDAVTTELRTGSTPFSNTALTNTKTAVKAGAGKVHGWMIHNPSAATTFMQVWDVAIGSITVGTTAPTYTIPIPSGASANIFSEKGITHSTEINVAATTTATGSSAPATALVVSMFYA